MASFLQLFPSFSHVSGIPLVVIAPSATVIYNPPFGLAPFWAKRFTRHYVTERKQQTEKKNTHTRAQIVKIGKGRRSRIFRISAFRRFRIFPGRKLY